MDKRSGSPKSSVPDLIAGKSEVNFTISAQKIVFGDKLCDLIILDDVSAILESQKTSHVNSML